MSLSDKIIKQTEFRRRHCDDVVLVGGFVWTHDVKKFIDDLKGSHYCKCNKKFIDDLKGSHYYKCKFLGTKRHKVKCAFCRFIDEKVGSEFAEKMSLGCGEVFEVDLIHKDGSKDILVCRCGGEDGLCDSCSKQEANNG